MQPLKPGMLHYIKTFSLILHCQYSINILPNFTVIKKVKAMRNIILPARDGAPQSICHYV